MAADDHLTSGSGDTLARRLRDAFRRVNALPLSSEEERERLVRRLLAICDAAKKDIAHAERRLQAFLRDLDGHETRHAE